MNENVKILNSTWRCGTVGFVLATNVKTGIQCAYIGTSGNEMRILNYGTTLSVEEALAFFRRGGKVNADKYYQDGDALIDCIKLPGEEDVNRTT